ncbi:hypothetical protein GCM10011402_33650 [Paracoccus acridae]|uniref:Uncharacterized protein n=1 Tax=Paracoccus acridae TaxID=1795310 RepID=A0ABQ1VLI9_9RHOB|nr:hypothetical protein GCM10011402_33650 [Paracoccus acridae]
MPLSANATPGFAQRWRPAHKPEAVCPDLSYVRLSEKFDPIEIAYGSQNVRAVGALTTARLQKPGLPGSVEHESEQSLADFMVKQAGAELAQDAVVEARVGQIQGQKVVPFYPRPNRCTGARF